jgi:hypothetical protein
MTKVKTDRRIGEQVFVVQSDGCILRTAIKSLSTDGYGLLLNKKGQEFFSFDEAIKEAEDTIKRLIDSGDMTRNEENILRERLSLLRTSSSRVEVLNQDLIQGSQMMGMLPERSLGAEVVFPTDYFVPGQKVFGIVTPTSHSILSPAWCPRPYFVLMITVREVSFSDKWPRNLYYSFEKTHYRFNADCVFPDRESALQAIVKIFAEETGGSILPENVEVFSSAEEEAEYNRQRERMIGDAISLRKSLGG